MAHNPTISKVAKKNPFQTPTPSHKATEGRTSTGNGESKKQLTWEKKGEAPSPPE